MYKNRVKKSCRIFIIIFAQSKKKNMRLQFQTSVKLSRIVYDSRVDRGHIDKSWKVGVRFDKTEKVLAVRIVESSKTMQRSCPEALSVSPCPQQCTRRPPVPVPVPSRSVPSRPADSDIVPLIADRARVGVKKDGVIGRGTAVGKGRRRTAAARAVAGARAGD